MWLLSLNTLKLNTTKNSVPQLYQSYFQCQKPHVAISYHTGSWKYRTFLSLQKVLLGCIYDKGVSSEELLIQSRREHGVWWMPETCKKKIVSLSVVVAFLGNKINTILLYPKRNFKDGYNRCDFSWTFWTHSILTQSLTFCNSLYMLSPILIFILHIFFFCW